MLKIEEDGQEKQSTMPNCWEQVPEDTTRTVLSNLEN